MEEIDGVRSLIRDSDEITPTCTACQRLGMPCGNYGATLSKAAYAEQKQDFLEQVRRKGIKPEGRPKRQKRTPLPTREQIARQEQLNLQLQLGMTPIDALSAAHDISVLGQGLSNHHFGQDISQDEFYPQVHQYDTSALHSQGGNSNNLFEINPRAATLQQLQQLQLATREEEQLQRTHDSQDEQSGVYDDVEQAFTISPVVGNEPYVPSMVSIDSLMNDQQQVSRSDDQRAAEEVAVRLRKEESLIRKRKLEDQERNGDAT